MGQINQGESKSEISEIQILRIWIRNIIIDTNATKISLRRLRSAQRWGRETGIRKPREEKSFEKERKANMA